MRIIPHLILIITLLLLFTTNSCNRAYNLAEPQYEGWDELVIQEGRAPINPRNIKLYFSASEVPTDFERIVLITAPMKVNEVGAADWEIARHFAAYHGANGVFLQGSTAAFERFSPMDTVNQILGRQFQDRIGRDMANFFGIRY